MSLVDFIVPKWRHSNPEVRKAAVREMAAEKIDTLERIALTDPETEVRAIAVHRIEDAHRLEEIAGSASEAAVKKAAEDRFNRLYHDRLMAATDRSERLIILEKMTDEERLADIAAEMADPDIRMAALARITRPGVLCKVAERHCGPWVGSEVVTRLDDPELLRRLSRSASNKKVRRQAEGKLNLLEQREETDETVLDAPERAEIEACCQRLERLLAEGNWPDYPAALADALTTWETHDPDETHPLRARFQQAADAIEAQLETFQRRGERQAALEDLCTEAESLAAGPGASEAVQERVTDLRHRWDGIDHLEVPGPLYETLSARFRAACRPADIEIQRRRAPETEAAAHRQTRLGELNRLCRTAEELAESVRTGEVADRSESLKSRWRAIAVDDPEEAPLRERFDNAMERCREEAEAARQRAEEAVQEAADRLRELCERVEAAVEAEERAGLEKQVRAAQTEWKEVGGRAPEVREARGHRFRQACDRFFQVQREFWENAEWERFANLTRKEELCLIVEALADAETLDGLPEMVREVQNRWKTIGPVAREKAERVWTRFRSACDRAYGRCRAEKERLAAEAGELVDGVPEPEGFSSAADWEAVSDALKALQTRWKAIGPLPRSMEKPLFEGFQTCCNRFFERRRRFYQALDQEREKNLAQKTALCQEAESLALSTDWAAAAGRIKDLQRQWKRVGPTPREASDPLWDRFQSACNTFFERLEAAKPEHLAMKQDLCRQVESLTDAVSEADLRETAHKIMALQEEWKAIGPVPEGEADPLWERFRGPCDRFFDRYRDHVKVLRDRQEENQHRKEAIAAEAESLAESGEWKETGDRLKALQKQWKETGPAPRKTEQVLWGRFRAACDTFFNRRDQFFASLDRERTRNLEKKEEICLRLEVLAQLVSPEQAPKIDASDRAAERLRVGLEYRNGVMVPGDRKTTWDNVLKTVRDLQAEWGRSGPVRGDDYRRLGRRYRRAAEIFFPPTPVSKEGASEGTGAS